MKNKILKVLGCTTLILAIGVVGNVNNHYIRNCKVIAIENSATWLEDSCGNVWIATDVDYNIGDSLKVKMFTNYTDDNIEDDIIVSIKKIEG